MSEKTTSTFRIHHDRCDPSKWTVREWGLLADYVRTGSLSAAAALSRAGMQLILDERHEAVGGEAEHIGWLLGRNGDIEHDTPAETIEDLDPEHGEVTEVVPIYRGKTRYAVAYGIGDGDGNFEGTEVEVSDTAEDAERFAKSMRDPAAPSHGGTKGDLKVGDRVQKIKGYTWPGIVVSVFDNLKGQRRIVVECTVPEVAGALHIYNPEQLALQADRSPSPTEGDGNG